jgi:hydroxymethylpyrimidine pyrophosphatase-like HAD family hydrolase
MKYSIDIDGTLFNSKWNDDIKQYKVISINYPLIRKVNELYDKGHTIIINTARHWDQLEYTMKQLKSWDVKYTTIVMSKPAVDYYVDDKMISPEDFVNEL